MQKFKQQKFKKKIKFFFFKIILSSKNFNVENSIIIFSEARGGSTWLMEILSTIPKTAINWEPLHVKNGVVPKKLNWGWRPYIHKESN